MDNENKSIIRGSVSETTNSMDTTLSLMKDLNSQTGQLEKMFSMQGQLFEAAVPDLTRLIKLEVPISSPESITSARQAFDTSEILRKAQFIATEEKKMQRKGIEAQIESNKILSDQREKLEVMTEAINALLKHNLEQSKQQAIAFQQRDNVESQRFRENTRVSKIAAWAAVISVIIAALAFCIQFFQ